MAKTFQDLLNEGQAKVLGIVSIVPMDDWNADTQYQKLNLVRHNGATYLAKGASKNVEPGVTQDWQSSWMLVYLDGVSPDGIYPELTAGRVMHALAWGNKNYDGSSAQTITAADLGLADVYKPQGSIAYSALPATPSADNYGYVWNITNDFTTDSRFIEGAGKSYSAGTNVGVIEQDGAYYYDIFGAFVDLSNYATVASLNAEITRAKAAEQANATAAANAQTTANAKYTKPSGGIPKSDLAQSVQDSLDKADSALQSAPVTSVNGETGAVSLSASDVGAATSAQGEKADQAATDIASIKDGTTVVGKAGTANSIESTQLNDTADLDDYYGADYWGKSFYVAGGNSIVNKPANVNGFSLEIIQAGGSTTIQRLTTESFSSSSRSHSVTYQRGRVANTWYDWIEIVESDGSYPTLGAGYLPYWSARAESSAQVGWHLIGSIENRSPYGSRVYSCIILVNGTYPQQGENNAEESGKLEIDVRLTSTEYSGLHLSVLSGNINPNEYCAVIEGTTLKVYANLPLSYATRTFVIQSEMIETYLAVGTLQTQDTFYGTTAPSGAVYAVNRNVARPLFLANQVQAKTPTVNTDMTLDGGVSPDGAIVGDEVIFYCSLTGGDYTCTGKIKSISGTTPTVTITGVVKQENMGRPLFLDAMPEVVNSNVGTGTVVAMKGGVRPSGYKDGDFVAFFTTNPEDSLHNNFCIGQLQDDGVGAKVLAYTPIMFSGNIIGSLTSSGGNIVVPAESNCIAILSVMAQCNGTPGGFTIYANARSGNNNMLCRFSMNNGDTVCTSVAYAFNEFFPDSDEYLFHIEANATPISYKLTIYSPLGMIRI